MSKKLILKDLTLSYPHLITPRANPNGGDPKFQAVFVMGPDHPQLPEVMQAVLEVATEEWGAKAQEMLKAGNLKSPLRNEPKDDYPEGAIYFSASSKTQPGMVHRWPGPDGNPAPVTDIAGEMYPGAVVSLSCRFFAYSYSMRKGVGVGLNNLQKLGDGPRLDGRTAAAAEFDVLDEEPVNFDQDEADTGGSGTADAESMNALLGL